MLGFLFTFVSLNQKSNFDSYCDILNQMLQRIVLKINFLTVKHMLFIDILVEK